MYKGNCNCIVIWHFSIKIISVAHAWSCFCRHTDETSLLAAIDGETFPGGQLTRTDFIEVIVSDVFNTSVGDRPNVPNVVILITDSTNIDRQRAKEASEKLQEAGKLKIFVVCVGDGCSEDGAKAVSSYPHEVRYTIMLPFDPSHIWVKGLPVQTNLETVFIISTECQTKWEITDNKAEPRK